MYNTTKPGLNIAENFYKSLSTGDPKAIQRATAPATEQVAAQFEGAKRHIEDNMPRSGTKDLAMQEADISKAAQIGNVKSQAYLGSFPALAGLAGQGVGLSLGEVQTALAGFGGAGSSFGGASSANQALGDMQGAGKAQTMGLFGSLIQGGAQVGSAAMLA